MLISQRPEEREQVLDLGVAQLQGAQQFFAIGMQTLFVQFRVVPDDVPQRVEAAVVHVWRRHGDIAQGRCPELSPVARREHDVTDRCGVGARGVVVELRQKVVWAGLHRLDALEAPAVGPAASDEMTNAGGMELAVAEIRSVMAKHAVAAADEQLQPAHGGCGVPGRRRAVAAG